MSYRAEKQGGEWCVTNGWVTISMVDEASANCTVSVIKSAEELGRRQKTREFRMAFMDLIEGDGWE